MVDSLRYPTQTIFPTLNYNTGMTTLIITNIVLGWIGAALVNYLADVLPAERKLTAPKCTQCSENLSWPYYLGLARCDGCGNKPTTRHKGTLILGVLFAGLLALFPLEILGTYGGLLWLAYFGLVTVIDLEHRLILHPVSLAGAVLGAVFGILNHGVLDTILGGAAGFVIMLIFYYLGELFVKVLSRRRGEEIEEIALGFGDVNLAGVIGLLLGWPGITAGIILAILIGGIVSGCYLLLQVLLRKYQAFQALPYGPFLVISTLILLFISNL